MMLQKVLAIAGSVLALAGGVRAETSAASAWSVGPSGVTAFEMPVGGGRRNVIDRGRFLGRFSVKYRVADAARHFDNHRTPGRIESQDARSAVLAWRVDEALTVRETFALADGGLKWGLALRNTGTVPMRVTDLAFRLPLCGIDKKLPARQNLSYHASINLSASYLFWAPFDGAGACPLLMPTGTTRIEYMDYDEWYFIHSETSVPRETDTWPFPSSSVELKPGESVDYGFTLASAANREAVEQAIFDRGGVNFRSAPGMVVPRGETVKFAVRTKGGIASLKGGTGAAVKFPAAGGRDGFQIGEVRFDRLGEQALDLRWGGDRRMMVHFFVIDDLENVIKKRAAFIVKHQQHRDPTKWYDGLYSVYDRAKGKLYSPDARGDFASHPFVVGGSDDPSNCKPLYVSEKNVVYPEADEIASLEYYERNFVWGKLQRTDKESPYPYGIYGSDNWHENRSGKRGDYNSGGSGRERMWRTFDYVTHIALYYNLHRIAKLNPSLVKYLDAAGYLERAYRTAMAFFEVPYNIRMGNQWAFHGWCDWAYKQGNFHERYILDVIAALEASGRQPEADRLRREWEKKVAYMVYEDPWPFGSEMFVDRTAFESSYYVGEYAFTRTMVPAERLWFDKNSLKWHSYTSYPESARRTFLANQLAANLAMRGTLEPDYWHCGSPWNWGRGVGTLDYMAQMGGVALLDYATRFAEYPADCVRYGYNSWLSSWSLIAESGAAGWKFAVVPNGATYFPQLRSKRGPWPWDGEIDHGFTGGLHGAGCYIVDDPIFGEIAYGGRLSSDATAWRVVPWDGVRRYLAIPQANRFEMKLGENGWARNTEVEVARDLSRIAFTLERRTQAPCERLTLVNLPVGDYVVVCDGKQAAAFGADGKRVEVSVPLKGRNAATTRIEVRKDN
ncbi:MAG: DUF5695 domain-containing protein [Kiritimatiellae bacterium]|nr:DUF5695 domain-containing protein [Kiritimatiellia bacterium]